MAAEVKINFRIGGVDAVSNAFLSVSRASERAMRQSVAAERTAAKERVSANRQAEREIAAAKRAAEREAERARRAELEAERVKAREVVAVVRQANREKMLEERKVERERQRVHNQERARADFLFRERQRALGGVIGGAASGAMRGARQSLGLARAVAGGVMSLGQSMFGLDVGPGRGVRIASERTKMATDLVNASVSGDEAEQIGMVERQKRARELMARAQAVGEATAMDPSKVLEGLQAFVAKTGDLKTGVASIEGLARLSRATGSDVSHMASAAGDVAANLGDVANKGDMVNIIMRTFAGQGKLGAVEVKDLSKQMAGLAANTSRFGNAADATMGTLGAMTQVSRQRGGAKSAAQAVTSVQAFVNTFSKEARVNAFAAEGAEFKDKKTGLLLDPEEIIVNALRKTGGDSVRMGKLFADVQARRATMGFETIFQSAGGGQAGEAAVRAEFAKMRGATLGKGDEAAAFSASMETPEAKAQKLQQRLDQLSMDLADKLMPAMLKFVPVAEKGADVLLKFVDAIVPHADALARSFSELIPVIASATPAMAQLFGFIAKHPVLAGAGLVAGNAVTGAVGAAAAHSLGQSAIGAAVGGKAAAAMAGGRAALTGAAGLTGATAMGALAAGAGGYMLGGLGVDAIKDDLTKKRSVLNEANNLEFKIRGGNATKEEVARGQQLVSQLREVGGGVTGFVDKVTGGNQAEDANKLIAGLTDALTKAQVKLDASSSIQIANPDAIAAPIADAIRSSNLQGPKAQTE
jgi:hypothetical protein